MNDEEIQELQKEEEVVPANAYVELKKWIPNWSQIVQESPNLLFHPLSRPLNLPPTWLERMRFPEEEGLYVGVPPRIAAWNLDRLRRRLEISEANLGERWLGPAREVAIEPDPLQYNHNRPAKLVFAADFGHDGVSSGSDSVGLQSSDSADDNLVGKAARDARNAIKRVPLKQPKQHGAKRGNGRRGHGDPSTDLERRMPAPAADQSRRLGTESASYVLAIDLVGLDFHDHPLMTEELRLSNTIVDLVALIRDRQRTNLVGFLGAKLEALRAEYDEFKRTSPFSDQIALSAEPEAIETDAQAATRDTGIYTARPAPQRSVVIARIQGAEQKERARLARLNDEATRFAFLQDIRATRLLRDAEAQTDRLLEFRILKAWDHLKRCRAVNGFSATTVNLKIILRSTVPLDDDKTEVETEIRNEIQELEDMHKIEQDRKRRAYERMLQVWTERHAEVVRLREQRHPERRLSRVPEGQSSGVETGTEAEPDGAPDETKAGTPVEKKRSSRSRKRDGRRSVHSDARADALFGVHEDPVPVEPKEKSFHPKRAKVAIVKRLEASRRPAGSPILAFAVDHSHALTDITACPKEEIARRRELAATFVYLRFYYNDKEVMRTVARSFDPSTFSLPFNGVEDLSEAEHLVKAASKHIAQRLRTTSGGSDADGNVKPGTSAAGGSGGTKAMFGIRVAETPESLRVEVYEAGVFGDLFLGEVFVAVPDASDQAESLDRDIRRLQFTGRPFEQPGNGNGAGGTGKGKGKDGARSTDGTDEHWISGCIKMNVAWAVDSAGRSLGPQPSSVHKATRRRRMDPISFHGPPGLLNLPMLMEWIADMRLDPNDPRNGDILKLKSLVQSVSGLTDPSVANISDYWRARSVFRLGIPQWLHKQMFGLGPPPTSSRLQLLSARYRKEIIVRDPMPLNESEIHPGIYEAVSKDVISEEDDEDRNGMGSSWNIFKLRDSVAKSPVDKTLGVGFLKRVREMQLVRKAQLAKPISVDDFVREERLVAPPEQANPLELLFRPRRPLNPVRADRCVEATASPEACRIVVQVLRGWNLPVRKSAVRLGDTNSNQGPPPIYVSPFVEVGFQQRKIRTSTAEGQHPQWNETIGIDITVPDDDFSPDALNATDIGTEMLFINLFDEVVIDLLRDERDRATSIHHRRERSWLGSLQVPFSTIWEQVRIDGEFKLQLPPQTHGYENKIVDTLAVPNAAVGRDTLLHLFITLDPPLVQPSPLKLRFLSDEDQRLLRYAKQWTASLAQFKRVVLATTQDLRGKTTLICRFIRPQATSSRLSTVNHLRRFVSMIPNIPNRTAFGCECSLWSTTHEILQVGAASGIEHAIMLCNFLLDRGHDAFVVLGRGIPEGATAYVIVRPPPGIPALSPASNAPDTLAGLSFQAPPPGGLVGSPSSPAGLVADAMEAGRLGVPDSGMAKSPSTKDLTSIDGLNRLPALAPGWLLYHPVTGAEHDLTDPHLPLKEIGCVFNQDNIWANIQQQAVPRKMHFRLDDSAAWRPFFGPQFHRPPDDRKSVQAPRINFPDASPKYFTDLETAIEAAVVAKVEEWRHGRVTRWNRMCSRTFKALMARFEPDTISGISIASTLEQSPELAAIGNVYRLTGFPLNAPFTDTAAACAMVHNTAVHSNYSPGVEFAVAVTCVGWPGRFVSLWIYIASLVRQT
ncbi:hypothetical protein BC831DRAFT_263275 [Entophlyctis helioformis]|nr:hypothetical protein BC831DRAFT_263275 [Entophlyctis helioformis]